MPRAPATARPARSRSPTAGISGTTWPSTPTPRSAGIAAACWKPPPGEAAGTGIKKEGEENAQAGQATPAREPDEDEPEGHLATRTRQRYADIRARLDKGHSQAEISRATGLARKTVRRFAHAGSADELLAEATARGSKLDEFKPYLCRRWEEGARDAAALHLELQEQGWTGSAKTVRRYVARFRKPGSAPKAPPAVPKTRQITRLLLTRPDHLDDAEQSQLARLRAGCPHIDALAGHVTAFAEMMDGLTGDKDLDPWLAAVDVADGQPELRSFANGIRADKQAVLNGLTLPFNSGSKAP